MSILVLVNGVGSEKEESQLNTLLASLGEIGKKHKLDVQKILAKNIPPHLSPTLCCYSRDDKSMVLLLFDALSTLGEARLDVLSLEAAFAKIGLVEPSEEEVGVDLEGLIFDKLSPEELHILSPLTQRQKEENYKAAKENEYANMPLQEKLLHLHKMVHDPHEEVLPQVKYEADPDTGKIVRKGNALIPKPDPFEITQGMSLYSDFYEPSNK